MTNRPWSRMRANLWLMLPMAIALAACDGPEGPAGESGPGTRLVFSGIFPADSLAAHVLPPEAGTVADPPVATCWVSPTSVIWGSVQCLLTPGWLPSDDLMLGPVGRTGYRKAGTVSPAEPRRLSVALGVRGVTSTFTSITVPLPWSVTSGTEAAG